jgi:hypothetical protein
MFRTHPGYGRPRILRHLHPRRHWDRPNPAVLTDQVHNAPPSVSLLDVAHRQRRHLGAPEPAAQ